MIRVDGHYLYQVGHQIHPITEFRQPYQGQKGTTKGEAFLPLYVAKGALETLLTRSVFQLRTSQQTGANLFEAIDNAISTIDVTSQDIENPLDPMHIYQLKTSADAFEAVLGAELALIPLFVVSPKGGYDLAALIDDGIRLFPVELSEKVPKAIPDIQEATKCLAFERYTASGFHLHRANESVLRRYWEIVTDGAPHPEHRNMGVYLNEMNRMEVGNVNVKSSLRDLKDFHRNPLIHPEHSIKTVDKAIALMNAIHNTITHMLDEIPITDEAESINDQIIEEESIVPTL